MSIAWSIQTQANPNYYIILFCPANFKLLRREMFVAADRRSKIFKMLGAFCGGYAKGAVMPAP